MSIMKPAGLLLCAAALPLLVACGGGGGGGSSAAPTPVATVPPPPPPPPPPTSSAPEWTQGVFEEASTFKDQCEIVRTGTDLSGNRYPDQAGSLAEELFWLRSWSDETYLWYNEITDRNPNDFNDKIDYFDELKTTARTPSGNARDRFHFTYDSAEWDQIRNSGSSSGYGAEFTFLRSAPPRDIRVAFTQPDSPADQAGWVRGTKILTIDGEDAINGSNTTVLNNGLSPDNPGEDHVFEVELPDGTRETMTLTSATVAEIPVNVSKVIERDGRRYGYVHFTTFSPRTAEESLFDAFDALENANVDDIILDLRYNGGGLLAIASQLSYMIAGENTDGFDFETLQFNERTPGVNPVTGETIRPTPFYKTGVGFTVDSSRAAPTLDKKRVFVLTTGRSCSASEAVMNGLRGIDVEVIQIGTRTCGKPYGFYATDNCGTTYFTIQFRGVNSKDFGDYADGFAPGEAPGTAGDVMPGCEVRDDFTRALGDPEEALLSTALSYAANGTCPSGTSTKASPVPSKALEIADPAQDLLNDPRIRARDLAENLRVEE